MKLEENGLLAEPTVPNVIRLAPPLSITREQIMECVDIFDKTFHSILTGQK